MRGDKLGDCPALPLSTKQSTAPKNILKKYARKLARFVFFLICSIVQN